MFCTLHFEVIINIVLLYCLGEITVIATNNNGWFIPRYFVKLIWIAEVLVFLLLLVLFPLSLDKLTSGQLMCAFVVLNVLLFSYFIIWTLRLMFQQLLEFVWFYFYLIYQQLRLFTWLYIHIVLFLILYTYE